MSVSQFTDFPSKGPLRKKSVAMLHSFHSNARRSSCDIYLAYIYLCLQYTTSSVVEACGNSLNVAKIKLKRSLSSSLERSSFVDKNRIMGQGKGQSSELDNLYVLIGSGYFPKSHSF